MELGVVLWERFGFAAFRGRQEAVVRQLLDGGSALVIMPTGMGKSLCYQLPSLLLPGVTLVVSPLIALMKDQVDAIRKKGIHATYINSSLSPRERDGRYRQLAAKKFQLVYVTPERFRKEEFWQALQGQEVSLLAVDEAHCISQWGHDFRPDYSRLGKIRERLGRPPTVALTATATPEVQQDILTQLQLTSAGCPIFIEGIERPNLQLEVEDVYGLEQKIQWLAALRHQQPGAGIVYFALISNLEKVSQALSRLGIEHLTYHGGLPMPLRKQRQNYFQHAQAPLMLATPAFGLGIDKSDVRLLVHAELPGSLEAYYQEVGRAGRDGQPSLCVLLYDEDDIEIQRDFIKWANPEAGFVRTVYQLIADHPEKVQAGGLDYLREQMNFFNRHDFRVETAVNLLERWDCVVRHEQQRDHQISAVQPPDFLDDEVMALRLKRQLEKLLEMVRYAKTDEDRKTHIARYFGA